MGSNYHNPFTTSTRFRASEMTIPDSELDKAITYLKNIIVHCDGNVSYTKSTGTLSWDDTLRILFTREDGQLIQNTLVAGSRTIGTNQIAYVDLDETNNSVLTMAVATASTGTTSVAKNINRLVLAYRNALDNSLSTNNLVITSDAESIATKDFWQGTQAQYDVLGVYDSNTLYFIVGE